MCQYINIYSMKKREPQKKFQDFSKIFLHFSRTYVPIREYNKIQF